MRSRLPLKSFRALSVDIAEYLTGKGQYNPCERQGDKWLFALDVEKQLTDRDRNFGPFDADGLPLMVFPGRVPVPHVSRRTAYGLACWNRFQLTGDVNARDTFLQCANWLLSAPQGRFTYTFDIADLKAPWISCMGQGAAIAVLARAHLLSGDPVFAEKGREACEPLMQPVEAGGLIENLPDGSPFVQEYPGSRHAHVLNGAMYAVCGVFEFARLCPGLLVGNFQIWSERCLRNIVKRSGTQRSPETTT